MSQNYWVVGAMFGGSEDNLPSFLKRGYWYCWDAKNKTEIPEAVKDLFPQIRVGDRVAVKKMLGRGSSSIEIRALGVVTDVDLQEWRVYVSWIVPEISRIVPIRNFMGSLHGPIEVSEWRNAAFSI